MKSPFPYQATIQLFGVSNSTTLLVDNSYFLGNKVMAVFGNVSMVAPAPNVTWSKLASTVTPGNTTLSIIDTVSWPVGSTIVITPTGYNSRQAETMTVTAVVPLTGGGTSITFTPPLLYRHAGEVVSGQRLAAGVGLVSRGIVFTGDNTAAGYGAHITVGQVTLNQDVFPGNVVFKGVLFTGVGQLGTEFPALHFLLPSPAPTPQAPGLVSVVDSCAFVSWNNAAQVENFNAVTFTNNVVAMSYRSAFDVDALSKHVQLSKNMVAGEGGGGGHGCVIVCGHTR